MSEKRRNQTFFGVRVPPWKDEKIGSGQISLRFVISGTIVSKKNHRVAITDRQEAHKYLESVHHGGVVTVDMAKEACRLVKPKIRQSREYEEFVKAQRPVLEEQKKVWLERLSGQGLKFPLEKAAMTVRFYFKSAYVTDTVNKQQTVQDLFQTCGIIKNDDYKSLNPIKASSQYFENRISENICLVVLSFQKNKNTKKT